MRRFQDNANQTSSRLEAPSVISEDIRTTLLSGGVVVNKAQACCGESESPPSTLVRLSRVLFPALSPTVSSKWTPNYGAGKFFSSSKVLSLTASFLTDREKEVARLRILKDGSTTVDAKYRKVFFKPLKDWKFYIFASIALCYGVATFAAGSFPAQIIGRFHYFVVKTNLFTVAPYAVGTIALCVTAWSSDRFREQGFHLVSSIILCNDPTEDGRAFRVGAYTFLANLGGIVSAQIFLDKYSPAYIIPPGITAGIEGLAAILIIDLRMWMYVDNRKRNEAQGVSWQSKDVPTEVLAEGPKNPMFRHFY
ncbi:uncharacterized protein IAS62_000823 [Cryptococcus decagattii]|uniref:Uncharacterized protein n=1 Tax=Cryptococcus decagattii TaxID=1859122 RepID=A0ABZ2AQD5_9TREE